MVDRSHVGWTFPETTHTVERGRLRVFADATGIDDPLFTDEAAAKAAGYPSLPIPPTFAFCLEMDRGDSMSFLRDLQIDVARVLHAEQSFTYHSTIHAGDVITFRSRVSEVFEKKNGALTFVRIAREGRNADGMLAVEMISTLVVRNG